MNLNERQENARKSFCDEKKNTIVLGVPGGGKTTLLTVCVSRGDFAAPFAITYNRATCDELQRRTEGALRSAGKDADAFKACTFHTALTDLFQAEDGSGLACSDDITMTSLLRRKLVPKRGPFIDALVVDECQDMRAHYAFLLQKIMNECCLPTCAVIMVGDPHQTVHDYHSEWPADSRYLTEAASIFSFPNKDPRKVKCVPLVISHRLPQSSCSILTKVAGEGFDDIAYEIRAMPRSTSIPKTYRLAQVSKSMKEAADLIQLDVPSFYSPGNETIAVMSNSVDSPACTQLINSLAKKNLRGKRVSICRSGEELTEALERRDICVLSFCLAKGHEFDHTYVHASHAHLWERYKNSNPLPNSLYVAITRHRMRCTIFWGEDEKGPVVLRSCSMHLYDLNGPAVSGSILTVEEWDAHVSVTTAAVPQAQAGTPAAKRAKRRNRRVHGLYACERLDCAMFSTVYSDKCVVPCIEKGVLAKMFLRSEVEPQAYTAKLCDIILYAMLFVANRTEANIPVSLTHKGIYRIFKPPFKVWKQHKTEYERVVKHAWPKKSDGTDYGTLAMLRDFFVTHGDKYSYDIPPRWLVMALPYFGQMHPNTRGLVQALLTGGVSRSIRNQATAIIANTISGAQAYATTCLPCEKGDAVTSLSVQRLSGNLGSDSTLSCTAFVFSKPDGYKPMKMGFLHTVFPIPAYETTSTIGRDGFNTFCGICTSQIKPKTESRTRKQTKRCMEMTTGITYKPPPKQTINEIVPYITQERNASSVKKKKASLEEMKASLKSL
jgi:hypothetical protein